MTTSDGWTYPLRNVSLADATNLGTGLWEEPGRIWTNSTASGHQVVPFPIGPPARRLTLQTTKTHGTLVWLNGVFKGRFEVFVYGGHNTLFSWSQMAFAAPVGKVHH